MTRTRSSAAPNEPVILSQDRFLLNQAIDNTVILPLQNLPPVGNTVPSVPGSDSSRSNSIYQEVKPELSKKSDNQLRTKIDTKIERALHQQRYAPLPAILELKIQVSLDMAYTGWVALLESKITEMIEKVARTVVNSFLGLQVLIESRTSGQARDPVDS